MLVCLSVNMLYILVLCPVWLAAGVQTLTIDSQLGTSIEDCFERISIGEQLPPDAIYRNVTELTTRECEQICKQDKQCQSYDYGVGAKGNATCSLSKSDEKTIKEKKILLRHPDYDVYVRRFQCEQSPPSPIQAQFDEPSDGPVHRPVHRPVDDQKLPFTDDYLISGDLENYGVSRPVYKPQYDERPDDYTNSKPDYDMGPSYGVHKPQDMPYRPQKPNQNGSYNTKPDPYDVLQFQDPYKPNDRPGYPANDVRPRPPYMPEMPAYQYIIRPNRKPKPQEDTGYSKPTNDYPRPGYGQAEPGYAPQRPYPNKDPYERPSYQAPTNGYGQTSPYEDNSIHVEIKDPPRPYKPPKPTYGQGIYGYGTYSQNSYSQHQSSLSHYYGSGQFSDFGNNPYRPDPRPERPGYGEPNDSGYGGGTKPQRPSNNKPAYGNDQPSYGNNKPSYNKPAYGNDQPSYGDEKPTHNKPAYGNDQPSYGNEKPSYNKPGYGNDQPSYGNDKPSYNKPAYGSDPPSYGNEKPSYNKPAYGSDQPSYGNDKPGYNKPAYGNDQPSYGNDKPSYGNDKPSYGSDTPTYGNDKPAYGDDRPSYNKPAYGDKPYGQKPSYGNDSPTYGNDKPSYSNQGSYGGNTANDYGGNQGGYGNRPYGDQGSYGLQKPSYDNKPSYGGTQGSYGGSQGGYGNNQSSYGSHGSSYGQNQGNYGSQGSYGAQYGSTHSDQGLYGQGSYGGTQNYGSQGGYGSGSYGQGSYGSSQGYGGSQASYGGIQGSYGVTQGSYGVQSSQSNSHYGGQNDFGAQGSYGGSTGSYGGSTGSYGASTGSYGGNTGSYGGTSGSYGSSTGSYGGSTGSYGGSSGSYGSSTGSYGSSQGSYGSQSDFNRPAYGNRPNQDQPAYGKPQKPKPSYQNDDDQGYGNRPTYDENRPDYINPADPGYGTDSDKPSYGADADNTEKPSTAGYQKPVIKPVYEYELEKPVNAPSYIARPGGQVVTTRPMAINDFELEDGYGRNPGKETYKACFRRVLAGKRALRSHVRKVVPCERLEDCRRECAQEKRFPCESFNYRLDRTFRGKGLCELMTKPIEAFNIQRDFVEDKDFDFFELDRNSLEPNCPDTLKGPGILHSGFLSSRPNRIPDDVGASSGWRDRYDGFDGRHRDRFNEERRGFGSNSNRDSFYIPYQINQGLARSDDDQENWGKYGGEYGGNDRYYKDRNDYHKSINHWRVDNDLESPSGVKPHSNTNFDYHSLGKNGGTWISNRYGYGAWKRGRWNSSGSSNGLDYGEISFYKPKADHFDEPIARSDDGGTKDCSSRRRPGMSLGTGAIRRAVISRNVVECEAACFSEREFKCVSYSFRYSSSQGTDNCFLSERPYRGLELSADSSSDVYAMPQDQGCVTINYKPWVESECFWHVRSGSAVSDTAIRAALTVAGLGACEAECIRAHAFFCRGFSFRFDSPTIGDDLENCILTSSPPTSLENGRGLRPNSGHELYARGNYGRGCEPALYDDVQHRDEECYLQYDKAARLIGPSIRGQARVKDEQACGHACNEAPFRCLSFSFNNVAASNTDNCLLSEIRLFDLQRGVDYEHSADDWLFAFDLFNGQCWRKVHGRDPTDQPAPEIPRPLSAPPLEEPYSVSGPSGPPASGVSGLSAPSGPSAPGYLPDHDPPYIPASGPPSGPGYKPGLPSGPGYKPGPPSGPGYNPGPPSGPGYNPGPPSGSGYNPGPPSGPGYKPVPQSGSGYRPSGPELDRHQEIAPGYTPNYPSSGSHKPYLEPAGPDYKPGYPGSSYKPGYSEPSGPSFKPVNPGFPAPVGPGFKPAYPPPVKPSYPAAQNGPNYKPGYYDPDLKPGYRPSGQRPVYRPIEPDFVPGKPGYLPEKPGYLPDRRPGYPGPNRPPFDGRPRPGKPGYADREGNEPNSVSWRHYTVSGFPCRAGTTCQQNTVAGHWACEPEQGEIGSWDYCCAPTHRCGYSEGFHKPWCYVGPNEDQWRPCSDKYYPYHQHKVPHPSQGHQHSPGVQRPPVPLPPGYGEELPPRPTHPRPWQGRPGYSDRPIGPPGPPGPYLSEGDRKYWDDLYRNGPQAYYDKYGNPLPGYSRVPTESRPHIKVSHNYPQPGAGHWLPVAPSQDNGQPPPGLGAARYWPVAYLHNGPPPNITYFRYNETQQTTTTTERNTTPREQTTTTQPKPDNQERRRDEKGRNISDNDLPDLPETTTVKVVKENTTTTTTTTELPEVKEEVKENITEVEKVKPEIVKIKEKDSIKGIDDKLVDFDTSIEVLDLDDVKGEKISELKTLEAEERQIEEIGRILASRRGGKLVLDKRSQKDLEAKNIAVDKELIDFNFGNRFNIERRGKIQKVSKDEIERERVDKSLEVSETSFVRPPRVLSTTENIRKAIFNGKVFYDATIREQRDTFLNSTRKSKSLRIGDDSKISNLTSSANFGKKIVNTRNNNPVRRVRRVYRKRYNPEEVRRRLIEREKSKNKSDSSRNT